MLRENMGKYFETGKNVIWGAVHGVSRRVRRAIRQAPVGRGGRAASERERQAENARQNHAARALAEAWQGSRFFR